MVIIMMLELIVAIAIVYVLSNLFFVIMEIAMTFGLKLPRRPVHPKIVLKYYGCSENDRTFISTFMPAFIIIYYINTYKYNRDNK